METLYDRDHIAARETLLDAVEALAPHSDAVILVGAQAIYVHAESEDASFALSPFTYDADIALDPGLLGSSPTIVEAMSRAGFQLEDQPGLYKRGAGRRLTCWCLGPLAGPAAEQPGSGSMATGRR